MRRALAPRTVSHTESEALGLTNREVAEQLHISVRTAESHRTNIQRKLALSRRSELVRFALARGLLLSDDAAGSDLMHSDQHE